MNMQYSQINKQQDRYEAAYTYIAQTFGHHTPYMLPDLVSRLVRATTHGDPESKFKMDAKTMYNLGSEPV